MKGPIILVGHSIGGFVTTEAAVGDPQVKALVYIAALMPDVGETATELIGKYPGATLGNYLQTVPFHAPRRRCHRPVRQARQVPRGIRRRRPPVGHRCDGRRRTSARRINVQREVRQLRSIPSLVSELFG